MRSKYLPLSSPPWPFVRPMQIIALENSILVKFLFLASYFRFYHRLPKRRRRMEYRQGLHLQQLWHCRRISGIQTNRRLRSIDSTNSEESILQKQIKSLFKKLMKIKNRINILVGAFF